MNNIYKPHLNEYLIAIVAILLIIPMLLLSEDELTIEEIQELQEARLGETVVKEEEKFLEIQTSVTKKDEEEPCTTCIYGYELFNDIPTTFALSTNVPIPQDYTLGPGDKLKIEYFGNNKDKKEEYISRNGNIKLPLLGPLNIAGQSMQAAEKLINKKVSEELIGTEVYLSLSELRSINVYLVGAAYKPGTYTVSSLASLTNVIFSTGGPDRVGSLRNIQVKRNGNLIKTYDFYKLLLQGDTSQDMRLQEGDTIFYPLIESAVRIDGSVQRPGNYEILPGNRLAEIIKFSGLLNKKDLKLQFSRFNKTIKRREAKILSDPEKWNAIKLEDGDSVNILRGSKQEQANVLLTGEFLYPGYYDISSGQTISEIIIEAGGLSDLAYPEGAIFTRESVKKQQKESYIKNAQNLERALVDAVSSGNEIDGEAYMALTKFIEKLEDQEPLGRQVASIDEYSLQNDPRTDFPLQDGDTIFVPKRSSSISVVGEVLNSTTLLYREDLTIQDYIELSGGTTEGADLSRIFIILPNGKSLVYKRKLFQNDIENELLPGSTIVVSRNPDPYNWLKLTSVITPILSDLAISAASISAISND
tara:strand:- start:7545 stop:9308 length:1764 start_codon:yes stop_codon:yes gene_type:complete